MVKVVAGRVMDEGQMTDDQIRAAAEAGAKLLAEGMLMERAKCWYCAEPGCKCGTEKFDRMAAALERIAEYVVDEIGESPRDVMAHVRSIAWRALNPKG